MNKGTATFLVVLRLAIAWHFLAEGWHKLHSYYDHSGKERPFSAAGYFREGTGPLAKLIRGQVGDPDSDALARLTIQPPLEGQSPGTDVPRKRVPPALAEEWQRYLDEVAQHYHLTQKQLPEARAKLEQAEGDAVRWLEKTDIDDTTRSIKKTYQGVTYEYKQSTPDRIAEYRAKVEEVRTLTEQGVALLGKDVAAKRLAQAKADVAEMRGQLLAHLQQDVVTPYYQSLSGMLTPEQRGLNPSKDPAMFRQVCAVLGVGAASSPETGLVDAWVISKLASDDVLPLPEPLRLPDSNWVLTAINQATAWGLTVLGGLLLLGLFTRTSCVLAALFLLTTYFCIPPWPWFLAPPNTEGFYYYINKNVIEMLALLVIATTASGRWFGLDAVLHAVFKRSPRRPPRVAAE
jgi:uncharacterized membrane protein YphA (DoxX/SURF4 family)